jgi:hypothetical protein
MTKEMYDHQKKAVGFIVAAESDESEENKAYLLCDDMGLGKTQAVVESFFVSPLIGRTLIVALFFFSVLGCGQEAHSIRRRSSFISLEGLRLKKRGKNGLLFGSEDCSTDRKGGKENCL